MRNAAETRFMALRFLLGLVSIIWAASIGRADDLTSFRPAAYAIHHAKLVTQPGATIESGTVVIRGGRIEAVGAADKVTIPVDAIAIDGRGLVVYPGLIDLYTTTAQPLGINRSATGSGRPLDLSQSATVHSPEDNRNGLTPEFQVGSVLGMSTAEASERRDLGFTDVLAAPGGAIATGQSALISTSGGPRREIIVKSPVALHINLRTPFVPTGKWEEEQIDHEVSHSHDDDHADAGSSSNRNTSRYPGSLMGVVAHLRQAMLDAQYQHDLKSIPESTLVPPHVFDPALDALYQARSKTLPTWWEANTRDEIHRALDLAEEFGTSAVIVGGREAGKVVDRLKQLNVPVVLRLDFPTETKVPTQEEYQKRPPDERIEPYQLLVENAKRRNEWVNTANTLAQAGVRFALTTDGLSKIEHFPGRLRTILSAGLTHDAALAALTQDAATIANLDSRLGTLEPGKLDHLLILNGPLGERQTKVRYVFVNGAKFEPSKKEDQPENSARSDAKPSAKAPESNREPEVSAKQTEEKQAETPSSSKSFDEKETPAPKQASPAPTPSPTPKAAEPKTSETPAGKESETPAKAQESGPAKSVSAPTPNPSQTQNPPSPAQTIEDRESVTPFLDVETEFDHNRKPRLETKGTLFIKDATILTVAKAGTIAKGSIFIRNGKIEAIGEGLTPPEGVMVIEAGGLVAMPGIIDSHSHVAIQGGSNESTTSVVAEVRIKDVITGDDPAIYRGLAGGTTTARILHGSADTIGGQDAVIKLKYGSAGRDLILKDAPQGVKFALGENVTRRQGRFPNTRMGVEATIDLAFQTAKAYQESWARFEAARKAGETVPAPRRDLRLEALGKILDGTIGIHSHCYRSDEILMLLRATERHGVQVKSLQHVLEGYKVAPEIAASGAAAATFSDWWAYKVEAYDAIPYNAALMNEAGVSVSIKSDSEELIRHLNLEAAKMVKYGGVSEAEALAMITINPARQLGLDDRLGSLEVGKDADIALFNGHPFDAFSRCELVLIDGELWFQRSEKIEEIKGRPGSHVAMPGPEPSIKQRVLKLPKNLKGVYALVGATLHPISGSEIPNGTLIIRDHKIVAIGDASLAIPAEAQTIDLQGLEVWPGMIDAGTRLGLVEINSLSETQDDADAADFEPELKTSTALRADSELIPVARANGILSAYVQPGGGLIAGQGCLINLDGWVPRELVVLDQLALHVKIPRYVAPRRSGSVTRPGGQDPLTVRREQLDKITEVFRRAQAYYKIVSDALAKGAPAPQPDPRLKALAPYAKGEKPVIFHADRQGEILDALKIADQLNLKAIISGGAEAWKVADALKAADVPVLIGGVLQLPRQPSDPYDAAYANPARLFKAGVRFAIRSDPSGAQLATASRNLPYDAAFAVAFGLPEEEALKAVTLSPAEILGVASELGSLEPGKRANLVITAGHLLQPTTEIKGLFLDGKPVEPASRHTALYEKYRRRLSEVKAGTALLGLDPKPAPPPAPTASSGTISSPTPAESK